MKALYVAASGMAAQQTRLDNVANNVANVGTTGYKKSREAFEDLFYQELSSGGQAASTARVDVGGGVQLAALEKDHGQGDFKTSSEATHMAIQGHAYFTLETVEGEPVYTRDGTFRTDSDGTLISNGGLVVGGDIVIPEGVSDFLVEADGTVNAVLPGDSEYTSLGQLELAAFTNPTGLAPLGGNLFAATPDSGEALPADPTQYSVQNYTLEGSNVDVAEELIEMIMAQRAYELNSKVAQAADEAMGVAVNLKR